MAKSRSTLTTTLYSAAGIIILVAAVLVVLQLTHVTHFFEHSPTVRGAGKPLTHLASTPDNKPKSVQPTSSVNITGDTDEHGAQVSNTPTNSSDWSISTSGLITVKLPSANGTFTSGDTIEGSAQSGPVFYTLIDNQEGEISQGEISVVNGNFTASVQFTHIASGGQLDVFNTTTGQYNGKQENVVQIPVNF